MFGEVVDESAADAKLPARQRGLHLALGGDVLEPILEETGDVARVARRGNGHDRARLRHLSRRGQHGGAAEAVADEDRRRLRPAAQLVRGGDEIADVGGKRRVGELTLARAEPGEVEAKHGDAERGEPFGHALGGVDVLAAGKAVRK